jgi:hypothetical protein
VIFVKYIPNAVTLAAGKQIIRLKKNSPAIMFGAGLAGTVMTVIKASQATLHLEEVIEKYEKDMLTADEVAAKATQKFTEKDRDKYQRAIKLRMVRDVAKLYAPAATLGVVSLGLLTGAHVTLTKRNVALASAYTLVDRAFKEYRERVRQELGDDKDREFRFGTVAKEIVVEGEHGHEVKTVKRIGPQGRESMYAKPFDDFCQDFDQRDEYNRNFLWMQQRYANDRLNANGYLFLNDVYKSLGMPLTTAGQVVGWVKGGNGKTAGDGYVDFGCFNLDSQEILDIMRGDEGTIWIDPNVDGEVYKLLDEIA